MADDTKYKDIFSVFLADGRTQLFSIDRDFKLWTMNMTGDVSGGPAWTEWQLFTPPGDSGGVMKITGANGSSYVASWGQTIYVFTRLWAIDLKNDLWTCSGTQSFPPDSTWGNWSPWVAPYPNN
jgi:hypothetical protein